MVQEIYKLTGTFHREEEEEEGVNLSSHSFVHLFSHLLCCFYLVPCNLHQNIIIPTHLHRELMLLLVDGVPFVIAGC